MPDFDTPGPLRLTAMLAAGQLTIRLVDTAVTTVQVDGATEAVEHTRIELDGDQLVVEGPRRSGMFRSAPELTITIKAPVSSHLDVDLKAADLTVSGELASARVRSGSGDLQFEVVREELRTDCGSGDVRVAYLGGAGALRSGSGDIDLDSSDRQLQCATGSGDVRLGDISGVADVRSGSGDVTVQETSADLTVSTASGDVRVRRASEGMLRLRSASGDVRVGVADGVAAWLDITTLSGEVSSSLDSSTEPTSDEARIAVHVNTASGDVELART